MTVQLLSRPRTLLTGGQLRHSTEFCGPRRGTVSRLTILALTVAIPVSIQVLGEGQASADSPQAPLAPAAGQFVPIVPVKVLDTRSAIGISTTTPLSAHQSITVQIEGVGGIPASGLSAVFINVSNINPSAAGYVTDYQADSSDPNTPVLTFQSGQNANGSDVVSLAPFGALDGSGTDVSGAIDITNHSNGSTHLTISVRGYYLDDTASSPGATYVPVPAASIYDTRTGVGVPGQTVAPVGAYSSIGVGTTGLAPAGSVVSAVQIEVGAINAPQNGFLVDQTSLNETGVPSLLSYHAGEKDRTTDVIAPDSNGNIWIGNIGGSAVDVQVIVEGFFLAATSPAAASSYIPITPQVLWDTRNSSGTDIPIPANGSINVQELGVAGIPLEGVTAVADEVNAITPELTGWLSVYPQGTSDPNLAVVNFVENDNGDTTFDSTIASATSPSGGITISNHSASTVEVMVSARGYFASPTLPGPALGATVAPTDSSGNAVVTWSAPGSDGGAPVQSYTVSLQPGSQTATVSSSSTSYTFAGLATGTAYQASIQATNQVGDGPPAVAQQVNTNAFTVPSNVLAPTSGWNSSYVESQTLGGAGQQTGPCVGCSGNTQIYGGTATELTGRLPGFASNGAQLTVLAIPDLSSTQDSGSVFPMQEIYQTTVSGPGYSVMIPYNQALATAIVNANSGIVNSMVVIDNGHVQAEQMFPLDLSTANTAYLSNSVLSQNPIPTQNVPSFAAGTYGIDTTGAPPAHSDLIPPNPNSSFYLNYQNCVIQSQHTWPQAGIVGQIHVANRGGASGSYTYTQQADTSSQVGFQGAYSGKWGLGGSFQVNNTISSSSGSGGSASWGQNVSRRVLDTLWVGKFLVTQYGDIGCSLIPGSHVVTPYQSVGDVYGGAALRTGTPWGASCTSDPNGKATLNANGPDGPGTYETFNQKAEFESASLTLVFITLGTTTGYTTNDQIMYSNASSNVLYACGARHPQNSSLLWEST